MCHLARRNISELLYGHFTLFKNSTSFFQITQFHSLTFQKKTGVSSSPQVFPLHPFIKKMYETSSPLKPATFDSGRRILLLWLQGLTNLLGLLGAQVQGHILLSSPEATTKQAAGFPVFKSHILPFQRAFLIGEFSAKSLSGAGLSGFWEVLTSTCNNFHTCRERTFSKMEDVCDKCCPVHLENLEPRCTTLLPCQSMYHHGNPSCPPKATPSVIRA